MSNNYQLLSITKDINLAIGLDQAFIMSCDGFSHSLYIARDEQAAPKDLHAINFDEAAVETADKSKSDFLAVMSHKIRTPMTSITDIGEPLSEPPASSAECKYGENKDGGKSSLHSNLNVGQNFASDFSILITEDNTFIQKLIQAFFVKNGVNNIKIAANGKECLDIFTRGGISAVIMDCHMPVMDGFEAARLIRGHEKKYGILRTPIIALTADYLNCTRDKCIEAGMDDFLTKPIDFELLQNKLIDLTCTGIKNTRGGNNPAVKNSEDSSRETIFDPAPIEELKKLQIPGKPDLISHLFAIYLKETVLKIDNLKKAAADKNAGSIRMIAHNLKSSTANVGGVKLFALFKTLENKAENNDIEDVKTLVEEIDNNYKRLEEKLKQMLEAKECK